MTNHWVDLKNADVLLIMGSNAVENHPIASAWIWEAKKANRFGIAGYPPAKILSVDPRFTRTSAKADFYAPIRSGTDIAFINGMIRRAIEKWETNPATGINQKYVEECTNALLYVKQGPPAFETCRAGGHPGLFSADTTWDYEYGADYVPYTTWAPGAAYALNAVVVPTAANLNGYGYQCTVAGNSGLLEPSPWPTTIGNTIVDGGVTWKCIYPSPLIKKPQKAALPTGVGTGLNDPKCVFQKLKEQVSVYTPQMVEKICGTPQALFLDICDEYIDGTSADDRSGTVLYAMGWTQHTVGTQNIRAASILQSLLGNIGVAGGGIDALRGWHNVQGATDQGVLYHLLPGYLSCPQNIAGHGSLGVGPLDASVPGTYLRANVATAIDPDAPALPDSKYWWSMFSSQYNRARYMHSLLKAWWTTDKSTSLPLDTQVSYKYLPKRHTDCSYMSLMKAIDDEIIKGLFVWGSNPMVMGPDQNFERSAMDKLEWLVVCDLFKTETAEFWNRPGANPALINTVVYLLPGAFAYEKEGSASNSGRLIQWRDQACDPPGDARDEAVILRDLGNELQNGTINPGNIIADDQIQDLSWPYNSSLLGGNPLVYQDLINGVAKELNGYALTAFTSLSGAVAYNPGEQINSFFHLDIGKTACGNWLHTGSWQKAQNARTLNYNQMKNRRAVDDHPQKIGIYRDWGFSWPVNRRIIYNRASVYQSTSGTKIMGNPIAPQKQVVKWTGANWDGGCGVGQANDVIDGFGTSAPTATLPYIMNREGVAKLMGIGTANCKEGPFPEHYEPKETPLTANILTGGAGPLSNPQAYAYPGAIYAAAGDPLYPIVCTTFRLTEHWHGGGCTRNTPTQCELMPEAFIEISEELAADKGISNGDDVKVYSARNPKGVKPPVIVKACVTKRFKPFDINGQEIHQVGLPWHWGFKGKCTGESANILTPLIGDANTRIPETKVFLVNIEKA